MANNIMNADALDSAAAQVSGIASNFSAELASLGSLVQSTHEFWNDAAQVSFENTYNEFKGTMDRFIESLNVYSTKMHQYAGRHREDELAGARSFDL